MKLIIVSLLFSGMMIERQPPNVDVPVAVRVAVERSPSAPRTIRLSVHMTAGDGFHVYAPGNPGYAPLELKIAPQSGMRIGALELPPAREFIFNLGETVTGYAGSFRVTRSVTFDEHAWAAARGSIVVRGTVSFQACTDTICLRRASLPLEWKIAQ